MSFNGFQRTPQPSMHTAASADGNPVTAQKDVEVSDEAKKIRRLQMMMNMVVSVVSQDQSLTVDEAAELVANAKRAALAMFPDKELAYDLIYRPRLQRLMRERFHIQ